MHSPLHKIGDEERKQWRGFFGAGDLFAKIPYILFDYLYWVFQKKKKKDSQTVIYIAVLAVKLCCSNLLVNFMPQDGAQQ